MHCLHMGKCRLSSPHKFVRNDGSFFLVGVVKHNTLTEFSSQALHHLTWHKSLAARPQGFVVFRVLLNFLLIDHKTL